MIVIIGERQVIVPACFSQTVGEESIPVCGKAVDCTFANREECIWREKDGRGPTLTETTPGLPKVR